MGQRMLTIRAALLDERKTILKKCPGLIPDRPLSPAGLIPGVTPDGDSVFVPFVVPATSVWCMGSRSPDRLAGDSERRGFSVETTPSVDERAIVVSKPRRTRDFGNARFELLSFKLGEASVVASSTGRSQERDEWHELQKYTETEADSSYN